MAIAFAEHPVSKQEKKDLLKQFDKVIDIRFAPEKLAEGDKLVKKPKAKKEDK